MVAIGIANGLPALHLGLSDLYRGLCLPSLVTAWMGRLQCCQALPSLSQGLLGLPQTTEDGERIALGKLMAEVKQIRDAQAVQTSLSQFDQGLGPITHQGRHLDAKRLEPRFDQAVP